MSVNMNVRRVDDSPRSSHARWRSRTAPRRSKVVFASVSSSLRPVLVSLAAIGEAEEHAGLRRLVRRADLVPRVARRAKGGGRSCPVVLGQPDPAVGELDRPFEDRRSAAVDQVVVGDRLELVRGLAGAPDLAGRERDLDLGGKASRAAERVELHRPRALGGSTTRRRPPSPERGAGARVPAAGRARGRRPCDRPPPRRRSHPAAAGSRRSRRTRPPSPRGCSRGAPRTPAPPAPPPSASRPRRRRIWA